ncbi:unnamed protein product [Auanema sp. JU1783]|nr:unnamed protein product [Auanema sp. JU1783]
MPGAHTFYDGSTVLQPLAAKIGVDVDKVNFTLCMFSFLPIAYIYRRYFPAGKVSRNVRSTFPLAVGLMISFFCFGRAMKHLLTNAFISYILMQKSPVSRVHIVVFSFSMSYLLWIHFYRWLILDSFSLDITGPMMVAVQKITTLAFNLHDGKGRNEEDLSEIQKKEAIREIPSLLDYLSFVFNFQTTLTGPINFYADYSKFLDGEHVVPDHNGKLPCPESIAWKKFFESLLYLLIIVTLGNIYKPDQILSEEFLALPYMQWFFWWFFTIFLIRFNYYFAWTFADSVCNMSGFGFSGYDEHNEATWELCTNVKPWKVEMAQSFKETLDNWNILTGGWFRRVAYDRTPTKIRTFATYLLSAVWHGISAGYYMTFFTGALMTLAGSTFRRCVRWRFLENTTKKALYDAVCFIGAKVVLAYTTYPFVAMNFGPSFFVYRRIFFIGHIIALLVHFVLPRFVRPQKSTKPETKKAL